MPDAGPPDDKDKPKRPRFERMPPRKNVPDAPIVRLTDEDQSGEPAQMRSPTLRQQPAPTLPKGFAAVRGQPPPSSAPPSGAKPSDWFADPKPFEHAPPTKRLSPPPGVIKAGVVASTRPPRRIRIDDAIDRLPDRVLDGRYQLGNCIGHGSTGHVYEARDLATDQRYAIKLVYPHLARGPEAAERFQAEAQVPARIGTDHVVHVIRADISPELDQMPFLVMELLDGVDLNRQLEESGALPPERVVRYLEQVALVLDVAHDKQIVHRDLKPANLFITKSSQGESLVKVLDFGVAHLGWSESESPEPPAVSSSPPHPKNAKRNPAEHNTELVRPPNGPTPLLGTPWYMAPEQAAGRSDATGPATDLWALGIIAFRLLTREHYWRATQLEELLQEILHGPQEAPSIRAPYARLPSRFDDWFMQACALEPHRRFRHARAQVRALESALLG